MKMGRTLRRMTALVLLALALMPWTGLTARAAGKNFTDVPGSAWYYDAVQYASSNNLFDGTSATEFSPNGVMTRGMFIKVLGRYAGVNESAWRAGTVTGSGVNVRGGAGTGYASKGTLPYGAAVTIDGKSGDWYKIRSGGLEGYVSAQYIKPKYHSFTDVAYDQYYAGYAIWGFQNGIVSGDGSPDRFSPDAVVTREQVCTLLGRYADAAGMTVAKTESAVTFPDDGAISSWAREDVYTMQQAGVIKGHGDTGNFSPAGSATRAEVAAVFQRFASVAGKPAAPSPSPTPTAPPASSAPPTSTDPDAEGIVDSPATFAEGAVSVKSHTIRVGLYVETNGIHTSAGTAVLTNENGAGFDFGSMSDRQFVPDGNVMGATLTVTASGGVLTVTDETGQTVYTGSGPLAVKATGADKPVTRVDANKDSYCYYGTFELRPAYGKSGNVTVINYVDLEDYVKGVMPYEFGNWWPEEALKAAAIACRSFVMFYNWNTYGSFGFDILNGTNAQVYRGLGGSSVSGNANDDAAVDATRNVYLTYDGGICNTCYSACNGGRIRSAKEGFGVSYPYLVAKDDPYDKAAIQNLGEANYQYTASISHRVGMSAWGMYSMAQYYNKDYQTILGFYYPGTHLQYGA